MIRKLKAINKLLSQMGYILDKKHRRKLPRLFFCVFFSSIFELLGVTAILPFVYALMDSDAVMNNEYAKPIFDYFGVTDAHGVLLVLGISIVVLYIVKNAFLLFAYWYQYYFNSRIKKELTIKLLHSFLSRPYQFFLDTTAGEISRACSADTAAVYTSIQALFGLAMSLFTTALIGVYMIISDPIIALGTLSVAGIAVVILTKILKPTMKKLADKVMAAEKVQNDAFNQTVYGIKELYVTGRQELFVDDYDKACDEIRKATVKDNTVSLIPNRLIESLFVAGFMGIVLVRLNVGGNFDTFVPKIASFAVGAFKVLPYISGITNKLNRLVYNKPFINNAYKNLKAAEEYQRELETYSENNMSIEKDGKAVESIKFTEKVEVNHVFWQYTKGNRPVLTDTSVYVKKGESIAFIGASGAGKTTLADIILGLLRPQQGSVYMDGMDVFAMPKTWAGIVGYVPQSVFLLAGTIKDNVAFGMKDFTDEEIWDALEKAQLAEFVKTLPEGIDTYVGERGVKLSGGQRQRIAIARALANKPEILVLDEATSALDNETETAIMESIDSLQGQITMIIVAHRLTTIKNCDRIYRIGEGIAREVSHEEVFGE